MQTYSNLDTFFISSKPTPFNLYLDTINTHISVQSLLGVKQLQQALVGEDVGKEDVGLSVGYFVGKLLGDTV